MDKHSISTEDEKNDYLNSRSHSKVTSGGSVLLRYQDVVIGSKSISKLIYFEICIWLSKIPGAIGLFLRKIFWPRLFGSCGKAVFFGDSITLRHPNRIFLGNRVVISDGCILDARNPDKEKVIVIDDDVILSNNVTIQCKDGCIKIGSHSGINTQTIIQSLGENPVVIGTDVFIGQMCFISGGGNYNTDKLDTPIWRQGHRNGKGVILENDIWLGANVTILDGVKIGSQSIVAAGAVVTKSLDEKSVSAGVPAKTIKYREERNTAV